MVVKFAWPYNDLELYLIVAIFLVQFCFKQQLCIIIASTLKLGIFS